MIEVPHRLAERLPLPLRRALGRRRLGRALVEELLGFRLVVLPDVFHPVLFRSSELLARTLAGSPEVAAAGAAGARAIDLGTGTGILALVLARAGLRVSAVDRNPEAVRCARANAALAGLELDVREGDLFAPFGDAPFDLIVSNPPFFDGVPADALDAAWRGDGVPARIVAEGARRIAPGGTLRMVLSSHGDLPAAERAMDAAGLRFRREAEAVHPEETLVVYRAERR